MRNSAFALLASRRFLPLFVVQFAGAANDNLFKNALAILVIYRLGDALALAPAVLVTLAAGLFILPFFLFSATAGQLADRQEKSGLVRWVKLAEIVLALLGALALLLESVGVLLAVLFGFGVHSAFFGPLKYALLPEYLAERDLIGGNALVEAGTFIAILLGTILGGVLILGPNGIAWVSALMLGLALAGYGASLLLPLGRAGNPKVRLSANIARESLAVLAIVRGQRPLRLSVLGISWFWLMGATFLAQMPAFVKETLGAGPAVVTLLLTVFSVGIGVGSVACGRLLKGAISARYVPWAAIALSIFSVDLYVASPPAPPSGEWLGPALFLADPANWRVVGDLFAIAVAGGLFIVPLYTILQSQSADSVRARAIAANNILNAAFMVGSALACAALLALGLSVPGLFLVQAAANLAVAIPLRRLQPR